MFAFLGGEYQPLLADCIQLQDDIALQEKAVDCLRILTTGNDLNQLALFSIPAGVRNLVRIMTLHKTNEVLFTKQKCGQYGWSGHS